MRLTGDFDPARLAALVGRLSGAWPPLGGFPGCEAGVAAKVISMAQRPMIKLGQEAGNAGDRRFWAVIDDQDR